MPKLITDPWDRQEDAPFAYCDLCGGEIYYGEVCVRAGDIYYHDDCLIQEVAGE